ncbi:hypothetical protein NDU88_006278 [Pleurodeles waltl]|uniref:Secreted protein n=1 Tax=Pleurodeles waltl TaxID=8319 RepID=A0AAV7NUN2_PLEWA|nr:hypothetical protein NDU88_006278 [Pleurodeles waltl]
MLQNQKRPMAARVTALQLVVLGAVDFRTPSVVIERRATGDAAKSKEPNGANGHGSAAGDAGGCGPLGTLHGECNPHSG